MSTSLNAAAQSLLDQFASSSGGKMGLDYKLLYTAVTGSSPLATWLNNAANNAATKSGVYITSITYASTSTSIANYDPSSHSITISQGYIDSTISGTSGVSDPLALERVQTVIGHESGHADDAASLATTRSQWETNVLNPYVADIIHHDDATNVVVTYQNLTLQDEGYANIQGWNDALSYAMTAGRSLQQTETDVGAYIFDGPGRPKAGITVQSNGSILLTAANERAGGAALLSVHPSINSPDLLTTYAQLETADALNRIVAKAHPTSITLDYTKASIDLNADGSDAFTDLVAARLLESGLSESSAPFNVKTAPNDDGTLEITRFQLDGSAKAASIFFSGDKFAYEHIVIGGNNDLASADSFDETSGREVSHTTYRRDSAGTQLQTIALFGGSGSYATSVNQLDKDLNLSAADSFDPVSGRWTEHDQHSPNQDTNTITYFNADGSQHVVVFDHALSHLGEDAQFAAKSTHANNVSLFNYDGSSLYETFDTNGKMLSARYSAADGSLKQSETLQAGSLQSDTIYNPSASVKSEQWTYDPSTASIVGYAEDSKHSVNWTRGSDGTWTESISGAHQASQPSFPTATFLDTLNADALLSHAGWNALPAYHMTSGLIF